MRVEKKKPTRVFNSSNATAGSVRVLPGPGARASSLQRAFFFYAIAAGFGIIPGLFVTQPTVRKADLAAEGQGGALRPRPSACASRSTYFALSVGVLGRMYGALLAFARAAGPMCLPSS
jgi:hypothetical protein